MGLYIGASLLSIFEIFDMLIFYCYRKRARKRDEDKEEAKMADKEKGHELESVEPPRYDGLVDRRHPKHHESSLSGPQKHYTEPEPLALRPNQRERTSPNRHHRRDPSPRDRDRDGHERRKKHRPDGRRKPRRPADKRNLVDGSSSSAPAHTPIPKLPVPRSPFDPENDIDFADDTPPHSPPRHSSPRNRSRSPRRQVFDDFPEASPSDSKDDSIPDPSFSRPNSGRRGGGEPDGQPDNTPARPFYSSKSNNDPEIHSPSHSATDSIGGAPRKNRSTSPARRYNYNPTA
jgi:hypothetical protein